jgi:hypothetical protein
MAKARSALFTEIQGSIGDITFSQNRYCAIIARKRPTLPPGYIPSSFQQQYQDWLRDAVARWQAITPLQRMQWRFYADATPHTNSLGQSITSTGQTFYIGVRIAALSYDPSLPKSTWDNPPCTYGHCPQPIIVDLSLPGSGTLELDISHQYTQGNMGGVLWMSNSLTLSTNYWTGPYDPLLTYVIPGFPAGSHVPINLPGFAPNSRVHYRIRMLDTDTYCRISRYLFLHSDV